MSTCAFDVNVEIYAGCSLATSSSFELQLCGKVAAGKLVTVQYTKPKDERTCTVSRISLNCGILLPCGVFAV